LQEEIYRQVFVISLNNANNGVIFNPKYRSMQKVLVAGATGSLGFEVVKMLAGMNIQIRALDVNSPEASRLSQYTDDIVLTDASDIKNLNGVLQGIDVIFSSVGQSVSLFSKSGSFEKIDYGVNKNLIDAGIAQGAKRFVYISIKGADAASGFLMANVHKRIEDYLKIKSLPHTVIRPVGFFSGFHDLLILGKKGIIPIPGSGVHKTNPIHQADLAQVVVDNLFEGPPMLEAGGPDIFTRNEIAQMIFEKTGGEVVHVPELLINPGLFFLQYVDEAKQAKLDYFKFVSTHDMVAPRFGKISLRNYIRDFDLNQLPDAW
jgi:uncharacterized protein YbjT (DUF2867 family)